MSANPPGETRKEIVSQGGGVSVSLSGGDERSEPESAICSVSKVDLWGWKQGPGAGRGEAAPAPALIHQNRNNGIEFNLPVLRDEFLAEQDKKAVDNFMQSVPSRLRKKIFALRLKIEWMVKIYGIEHIGLQTMTIRENVTDRKEFERRFKSISTNVFPKLFLDWLRVFERQQRGAWHAHVVVVTKDDIRTGTDVVALNQLFKDKRDRTISKAVYYSGIKRLASPNIKAVWKEFRRLCGLGEFKARRQTKGARYYKFDACHLLPIISTAQALAVYVSKYISKGFEHRRPEDKGMRLVGSTRNVSRVCIEHFSWAGGGGKLWRAKLGILAGLLNIKSLDEFAELFGPKWAYHLQPAIVMIELPYYENMKLARLNGWDLRNECGEPWLLPDLTPSKEFVWKANFQAFVLAKEILLHHQRVRPDRDFKRCCRFKPMPETDWLRPMFKSCEVLTGPALAGGLKMNSAQIQSPAKFEL
jgi:hypothetical protein